MPHFDPNDLADEFDPAIIATFEHENWGVQPALEHLLSIYGQYEDLFQAYTYAKEEILPEIRTKGRNAITPQILLNWLNSAHARIAASLATAANFKAGEFTTIQVVRWHWGMLMQDDVTEFFGGVDNRQKIIDLALKNNLSRAEANDVIKLLEDVRDRGQIVTSKPLPKEYRNNPHFKGTLGFTKLVTRYHQRDYSPQQLATLNKLVVICMPPKQFPGAMLKFATEFTKAWQQCDANNLEQIADLLYRAYNGVAGIHPYANCNGRLATWLLNVVLRSFNKPSILMREKGEKFNADSSYSRAIAGINTQPELFKEHVKQRILRAEQTGPVECSAAYTRVMMLVDSLHVLQKIQSEFPEYPLANQAEKLKLHVEDRALVQFGLESCLRQEPAALMFAARIENNILHGLYDKVKAEAKPRAVTTSITTIVAHQFTAEEKSEVIKILSSLTNLTEWKAYKKDGATVVLHDMDDDDKATTIIAELNKSGALQAELKRKPDTKKPVILLTNINLLKLREYDLENKPQPAPTAFTEAPSPV